MVFQSDRQQNRQLFYQAWHKHVNKQTLEPIESIIVEIIQIHPEYHKMLEDPADNLDKDYLPETGETNPFLHMGMHIAIKEQISINQPHGIQQRYQDLLTQFQDAHEVEHKMMDCLVEMIWSSQKNNSPPDTNTYLKCLENLKQP